ncbi:thiol protease SEN102-like [Rhododendron vialii]|uniref:thiol protease SEN102-like n=1 Tax=Rhododendron vialii TaxID=182163 RepID=UPI00265F972F|nr:thiol protease SEN102-like [Rhododendron vialii]
MACGSENAKVSMRKLEMEGFEVGVEVRVQAREDTEEKKKQRMSYWISRRDFLDANGTLDFASWREGGFVPSVMSVRGSIRRSSVLSEQSYSFGDWMKNSPPTSWERSLSTGTINHDRLKLQGNRRTAFPSSFDWRERGLITNIKDQGNSPTCYAHVAVTTVEYAHQILTKEVVRLSPQELWDAGATDDDDDGPLPLGEGGRSFKCLKWIAKNGISLEADYPWEGVRGPWRNQSSRRLTIDGHMSLPIKADYGLYAQILERPVSITIAVTDEFEDYEGGIYWSSFASTSTDHEVVVLGWDAEMDGTRHWICQNSWGEGFGEGGFVRIARTGHSWWGSRSIMSAPCYK